MATKHMYNIYTLVFILSILPHLIKSFATKKPPGKANFFDVSNEENIPLPTEEDYTKFQERSPAYKDNYMRSYNEDRLVSSELDEIFRDRRKFSWNRKNKNKKKPPKKPTKKPQKPQKPIKPTKPPQNNIYNKYTPPPKPVYSGGTEIGKEESSFPQNWGTNLDTLVNSHPSKKLRSGSATTDDKCDDVMSIPSSYRSQFTPTIPNFYTQYTEVYGIPVIGSRNVTKEGLKRICYMLKVLLADRYDIRNVYYRLSGRFAAIGDGEQQTSLYEYSTWKASVWNHRVRGLGPTVIKPITSCGDDNQRCKAGGRYFDQDVGVHEFAHAMEQMGAEYAIPGFRNRLIEIYKRSVVQKGRWKSKYAAENAYELFAVGTQFFHNAFRGLSYSSLPVRDRDSLRRYDPELYKLLQEVFPCAARGYNTLIHRCQWKACTTADFKMAHNTSMKARSNCPQVTKSDNKGSADECAAFTCYHRANVFNWKGSHCEVLKCKKTVTNSDLEIKQGASGLNIYTIVKPVDMDLRSELSQKVRQFCTKGPDSRRCNVPSSEQKSCSSTHSSDICRGMGCCWTGRSCYYPLQDCADKHMQCTRLSKEGECDRNPALMYDLCPMACNVCHLLHKLDLARLRLMCKDTDIYCKKWAQDGECRSNPVFMNRSCPLACKQCTVRNPLSLKAVYNYKY